MLSMKTSMPPQAYWAHAAHNAFVKYMEAEYDGAPNRKDLLEKWRTISKIAHNTPAVFV